MNERLVLAAIGRSYWYNGKIYVLKILRGLDVIVYKASEFLTENRISTQQN